MNDLLFHPDTRQAIEDFLAARSHALLLTAPHGAGKGTVARIIASRALNIAPDKLADYPYVHIVTVQDGKSISIDAIREVIHFTSLKVAAADAALARIVIIEHAEALTLQAQNALLKTIEEPPLDTLLILTAPNKRALLPTILSRTTQITIKQPELTDAIAYFTAEGFDPEKVSKSILMAGGLVGLATALLQGGDDHPLIAAASMARAILQKSTFERLILAEELSQKRQLVSDVLSVLGRMASVAMRQPGVTPEAIRRWHHIMAVSHAAYADLSKNAQLKLVLLNFMLSL